MMYFYKKHKNYKIQNNKIESKMNTGTTNPNNSLNKNGDLII